MKHLTGIRMMLTSLMILLVQVAIMAQDSAASSSSSTTTTSVKTTENWYASPWVWVAGAAVFILLLVALTRGSGSSRTTSGTSDRVTVTKSVRRDTDV